MHLLHQNTVRLHVGVKPIAELLILLIPLNLECTCVTHILSHLLGWSVPVHRSFQASTIVLWVLIRQESKEERTCPQHWIRQAFVQEFLEHLSSLVEEVRLVFLHFLESRTRWHYDMWIVFHHIVPQKIKILVFTSHASIDASRWHSEIEIFKF